MLSIDTLANKPVNNINGIDVYDLTVSSINPNGRIDANKLKIVPTDFNMRPDLLCLTHLGDQDVLGTVLKINGISNPFSLNEGDIIIFPSKESIKSLQSVAQSDTNNEQSRVNFRKKLIDRISSVSADRKNYLESRSIANSANTPLPPNIAGENDQQFVVSNGKLIFGSSIGNCRTNVSQNKSKATIKARLTQQKIFG